MNNMISISNLNAAHKTIVASTWALRLNKPTRPYILLLNKAISGEKDLDEYPLFILEALHTLGYITPIYQEHTLDNSLVTFDYHQNPSIAGSVTFYADGSVAIDSFMEGYATPDSDHVTNVRLQIFPSGSTKLSYIEDIQPKK